MTTFISGTPHTNHQHFFLPFLPCNTQFSKILTAFFSLARTKSLFASGIEGYTVGIANQATNNWWIAHVERFEITLPREWNPFDSYYNDLERTAIARSSYVPPIGGDNVLTLESVTAGRPISASTSWIPQSMSTIINQGHVSPSSLIMAQILPGYDGLDYGDRIIQQTRFSSVNTSRFATPDAALIATYFHMTPKIAERTATSTRFCSIPRSGLQCGLTGRKLRTYHHDSDRHKHLRVNVFVD